MSNTTYTDYSEPSEEAEEPMMDDMMDRPPGFFGTPARAITTSIMLLMLLIVGVVLAWKAGEIAAGPGTTASGNTVSTGAQVTQSGPKNGMLAPDFQLIDVKTNKPVKLSSLRGKPVWINFWGTWCPPCRAEMPEMEKIYGKVKDDVVMLGISMGPRDEPQGVAQFVDLNKYSWNFIHDVDGSVMQTYQVTGIPSSFFIDKAGVIRAIHVGGADASTLEGDLAQARQ